jgi:hypothetical protein
VVDAVTEALDTMKEDIGTCQTDVRDEARPPSTTLNETRQALEEAIGTLDQVKQMLASYHLREPVRTRR